MEYLKCMVKEINNFGYCGKNCRQCVSFKNNKCNGCKIINNEPHPDNSNHNYEDCKIKFCAEKKGISFCFLCQKFPCHYFSFLSKEELSNIFEQKAIIFETDENN